MIGRAARARTAAAALALAAVVGAAPSVRGEELSDGEIIGYGAAMAVPGYFLGVTLHEGSHALAAIACGAEIEEIRLLPGFIDGHFYFGYTRWRGHLTRDQQVFALIAPKLTDLAILATYAVLLDAGALPEDDRGELAIATVAGVAWVDFVKDTISFNPTNDVMRIHALHGRTTELQRLPLRIMQVAIVAGGAYVLARGAQRLFDEPDEPAPVLAIPLVTGRF